VDLSCDIAVIGSGYAGSLFAMIARRLGRSVILLERGRHPRFVIGESSTPLANLLLEELACRYDLPRLAPLSKWGTWQRTCPQIACGLKRGFTFYHHEFGKPFQPRPDRANELLVGASPNDGIADTHWYRPHFDQFLVKEAQALGAEYFDEVLLSHAAFDTQGAHLKGERAGQAFRVRARFVADATGPHGFLHRALKLGERDFANLPATCGLYTHFTNVRRVEELLERPNLAEPPYPPDDAALHHVFEGGWIWVLRFNNGITSAGAAVTEHLASRLQLNEGAPAWERLLQMLPSVRAQFAEAKPTMPFIYAPRLSFRSARVVGKRWALLPSAAGFIDPLLSTGFPLTLLGVSRLAVALEEAWGSDDFETNLQAYGEQTIQELLAAERLVAALYSSMNDFPVFSTLSLLYFAAASFSETARRLGKPELAPSFLLHDQAFGSRMRVCCEFARLRALDGGFNPEQRREFWQLIQQTIAPIDVAGLSDFTRRNWYPANAEDLLAAAPKLRVDHAAMRQLLVRCGFHSI